MYYLEGEGLEPFFFTNFSFAWWMGLAPFWFDTIIWEKGFFSRLTYDNAEQIICIDLIKIRMYVCIYPLHICTYVWRYIFSISLLLLFGTLCFCKSPEAKVWPTHPSLTLPYMLFERLPHQSLRGKWLVGAGDCAFRGRLWTLLGYHSERSCLNPAHAALSEKHKNATKKNKKTKEEYLHTYY